MSKRFSERILEFLRQPEYRPMKARKLAIAMGIAEAEFSDFHDAVDALRRVGRVVYGTDNAVTLPHPPSTVVGTFRGNPRGFGFVVPEGPTSHGDLYIAQEDMLDAVTGDRVRCTLVRRGMRDGKQSIGGRIVEIVERGNNRFVGQLRREGGLWIVQPDGNTLHVPITIADVGAKGAKEGDQVVAEIIRYPSEGRPAKGVIVERLGKRGQTGIDLLSIIHQYHLPTEFSGDVLDEVRAAAKAFDIEKELSRREDLSERLTITIDPDDAKDFDDAITLERFDRGPKSKAPNAKSKVAAWELGVHIADVSSFVKEGGTLDDEARTRGTSVYFPGHVIPMLPELLSNGLCSLQEGEQRLCKSAFIQYDAGGNVLGARFANTVIRSAQRLTYTQAQAIIDGDKKGVSREVVELLERMDTLARTIRKRRLDQGMIVLELPEVKLILNDDGQVADAEPEDTSFTHTIIEMFMVEANEAVARLFSRIGVPFLRRIHPPPSEEALQSMALFMRAAGHNVPKVITPADLQALLDPLRGKPEGYAIHLAVLKSMQTAEYSPKHVGHFALASKDYTHFTSPIRRYVDLMIHRLLQLYLDGELKKFREGQEGIPSTEALTEIGTKLSYAARRAESAEDELKTVKVLELLTKHIGEVFEGVVTGVTNFGLFIQHPKYLIDGLLRIENLGDDWWEVDARVGRVVGERTRQSFTLGTILSVSIAEVDISARQLGLALVRKRQATQGATLRKPGRGRSEKREKPGRRSRKSRRGRR
jgi:ribonuclease R